MTEDEKIKLLSNTKITAKQLAKIFDCSIPTISRMRKKYGIKVPRGLKPGQSNNKIKKYKTNCIVCNEEFYTIPSSKQKHCSRKCVLQNEEVLNKFKSMNKAYMQTEEYRKTLMKKDTPEYRRYRNRVTKLSEQTYSENKHILNPNNHKRTKCGVDGGYQLDHIVSVRKSYDNGISPEDVSKLENLQFIPWKQNLLKR